MLPDKDDCPCSSGQIQYWLQKAVQTDFDSAQWEEKFPLNPNQDATTFEYRAQGDGERSTDLSETYMMIEVGVDKADGTDREADDEIALSNNTFYTLFQQVLISFNGVDVTPSNNTYHVKSYLETLLSYGAGAKNQIEMGGWFQDTPGKIDTAAATSLGYVERKKWIAAKKKACFIAKINLGLTNADQLIPNGVDIRFKFTKCKDSIILQQPAANAVVYKTVISKAVLYVRRIKLSPHALVEQAKRFNTLGPATIHVRDAEVRTYAIPTGMRNHKIENLCEGQLPEQMVIGFVANDAYNGHKTKRFYNFQPYNISHLQVLRDGIQHPATPFKPSLTAGGNYIRAYHSLYVTTGKLSNDEALPFSMSDYIKGYTLFGFNFSPDLSTGELSQPRKSGSMSLEVNFSADLPEPVNVVVYMTFDRKIKIDKNRTALPDFSP